MCMGLCVKTEADNIPVDLGEMVVDSLGNDCDGDSRESGDRIEDENDAKSPKIRKKHGVSVPSKQTFPGGQGGTKWRESLCLWGIDGVFAYMKFSMT